MAAHITIIPPFRVSDEAFDSTLRDVSRDIAAFEPFSIHLRGTATFDEGSTTVFLRVAGGSDECARLRECLDSKVGTGPDASRHPMVPHVTIVNRADAATTAAATAEFDEFEARFKADRVFVYELGAEGWTVVRVAGFRDTRA